MEKDTKQKISLPASIVVAGLFIAVAILLTKGSASVPKEKTLSEQVGVSKGEFTQCLEKSNLQELFDKTNESAEKAMSHLPQNQRGTPYIVLVGKDGTKIELRGAIPYDDYLPTSEATVKVKGVKSIVDSMIAGKATSDYKGDLIEPNENDHIIGSLDASVIIVEYSDLECPFCMKFGETAKKIVGESNGQVAWIYRHWIVHSDTTKGQYALPKAAAAECVAEIKGSEAFWKYVDLVFGLMNPKEDTSATDLL
jgi:protein-disulfide isomerase